MTECEKYRGLVSCLIDGEITGAEKARLDAHLASCPACRAYQSLLEDLTLEQKDPPASLLSNVMDAARKAPKPKNVIARRWVTGSVAAAACLAVIVLAALPTLEELQYRQGIGMENQIERTRLIGIRKATEEQLYYQRNRYEEM